jgi:hypothetical protein
LFNCLIELAWSASMKTLWMEQRGRGFENTRKRMNTGELENFADL